ncbi:c-type cytochrome [Pseudomonas cichorii]|uniref:Cytochrome c-551 n=1 Tax=Pseudomonas cichorii TaxID=36746 RepID=A0A3M4VXV2_PSECI|nr:c-type cytochrome [Pseudomonas cichorii]RMR56688.1 Cytochrome c s i [Pseudomonas cichorii]
MTYYLNPTSAHKPQGIMIAALVMSLGGLSSLVLPAQAEASQALAQRYVCTACHQPAARVVGPSWKEIAQKYSDGNTTAEQIAGSIKSGSTGKWGPMSMPPQAQVSDADLKSIAQWLLDGAP